MTGDCTFSKAAVPNGVCCSSMVSKMLIKFINGLKDAH
jgi:hypothetical protein